jgi:hypothetical protein
MHALRCIRAEILSGRIGRTQIPMRSGGRGLLDRCSLQMLLVERRWASHVYAPSNLAHPPGGLSCMSRTERLYAIP